MLPPLPLLAPPLLSLLLTTALATNTSTSTTALAMTTEPPIPLFAHPPCAFAAKHHGEPCAPQTCHADGGRCHLSVRNRCAEHQIVRGEVVQRSWLYSSAPASCLPCKCVKAWAVSTAASLRKDRLGGGKGRKRKGEGRGNG